MVKLMHATFAKDFLNTFDLKKLRLNLNPSLI